MKKTQSDLFLLRSEECNNIHCLRFQICYCRNYVLLNVKKTVSWLVISLKNLH